MKRFGMQVAMASVVVGAGCAAEPGDRGAIAQSLEEGEVEIPGPLTDELLAGLNAGNAAVVASVEAFDDLESPASVCAMELTCQAGGPAGPVGEPGPVGQPGPVGLVAATAIDLEAVCALDVTSVAATIASLQVGMQAMFALVGNARQAVQAAKEDVDRQKRIGTADSVDNAEVALINAEARLAVLEIQRDRLLPALAALLADPCSVEQKLAVAHANVDIARINYNAATAVRAKRQGAHARWVAARLAHPLHVSQADVDKVKKVADDAVVNEAAAKAVYEAALAELVALLLTL